MKRLPYLYYIPLLYTIAGVAFAVVDHSWATARPNPNFQNLPAYITELDRSQDPQMMAFKRQIAAGPARLAREKQLAQVAGMPLTIAQIQPKMPPVSENAAPIYRQIDRLQGANQIQWPIYANCLVYGYRYTPDQLAAVQKIVSANGKYFSLIHQAASKPYCVFRQYWFSDGGVVISNDPGSATFRACARDIVTECYLLASEKKYSQAITTQALGYHIAQQAASEPSVIGLLVAIAVDAITTQGMRNIMDIAGPNAAVDLQVEKAIKANQPTYHLPYSLRTDIVDHLGMATFSLTHGNAICSYFSRHGSLPALLDSQDRTAENMAAAAEADYLSKMRRMLAAAHAPELLRYRAMANISPDIAYDRDKLASALNPINYLERRMFFMAYASVSNQISGIQSLRNTAMAAAAVLAVKAKTGSFPKALPGRFIDPFDGKQLGYRREGKDGFVVYSVGSKDSFNGGQPGQYKFTQFEILYRYPKSPQTPVPADMLN